MDKVCFLQGLSARGTGHEDHDLPNGAGRLVACGEVERTCDRPGGTEVIGRSRLDDRPVLFLDGKSHDLLSVGPTRWSHGNRSARKFNAIASLLVSGHRGPALP